MGLIKEEGLCKYPASNLDGCSSSIFQSPVAHDAVPHLGQGSDAIGIAKSIPSQA